MMSLFFDVFLCFQRVIVRWISLLSNGCVIFLMFCASWALSNVCNSHSPKWVNFRYCIILGRLGHTRVFFPWFTKHRFFTELNFTTFTKIFIVFEHQFVIVPLHLLLKKFCPLSEIKLFLKCNFCWWKPFIDIFFQIENFAFWILRPNWTMLPNFGHDSVNMLGHGVVVVARNVKNCPDSFTIVSFLCSQQNSPLKFLLVLL